MIWLQISLYCSIRSLQTLQYRVTFYMSVQSHTAFHTIFFGQKGTVNWLSTTRKLFNAAPECFIDPERFCWGVRAGTKHRNFTWSLGHLNYIPHYVTVILYFKKRKGEGERKRKDEVLINRTDGRSWILITSSFAGAALLHWGENVARKKKKREIPITPIFQISARQSFDVNVY